MYLSVAYFLIASYLIFMLRNIRTTHKKMYAVIICFAILVEIEPNPDVTGTLNTK